MALDKNQIAKRIAQELERNMYVNLGIGIPTLVANYIPEGIDIEFQSENGVLGMGPFPFEGEEDESGPTSEVCDNESGHHAVAVLDHLFSPFYPYNITPIRVEVKV